MTSSTPRVMFAITGLGRGGAQSQIVNIATGLVQRGWCVTVVSCWADIDGSYHAELEDHGVTVLSLDFPSTRRWSSVICSKRIFPFIRRYRPHVLVGFLYTGIMSTRITGRLAGVPVVISSIRNERSVRHNRRQDLLFRLTDRFVDAVTTMSHLLAREFLRRGVAAASHTHVIPNGIDLRKFDADICRAELRRLLGVEDGQFLWLAAGGLREQKDYPNLLQAFSILSESWPDARLAIAGEGRLRKEVTGLVEQLNLSGRVQLLGLRTDMPRIYPACDAFVLSSAWEGVANVVLEAMACSRPVVTTTAGGISEFVRDGVHGYVVPVRDHVALKKAMDRMMILPDSSRKTMGDSCSRRIREELSRDRIVDMWEDLFKRMLNKKGFPI